MVSNTAPQGQKIHTVTTLNRLARNILTSEIGLVWLTAEISNFVRAASGHWYFTLKDDKAQVRSEHAFLWLVRDSSVCVWPGESLV